MCRAIGHERAEETLFKVLQFRKHPSSAAREGLLWFMVLFVSPIPSLLLMLMLMLVVPQSFLPAILSEDFSPYISVSLPVIVAGLSDSNDGVREVHLSIYSIYSIHLLTPCPEQVALRAGQVIVNKLGILHTNEIIPTLTEGMFDEDWRIRHSSVKLLGELLYLVGDTKAVGLADENDEVKEPSSPLSFAHSQSVLA